MDQPRYRDVCFTAYQDVPPVFENTISYLVYQQEECPETGRLHWQCFAQCKNAKTTSAWQKCLEIGKSHCERMRGTPQQASDYCKASEWEGKPKGQVPDTTREFGQINLKDTERQRTDLVEAAALIRSKRRWQDVFDDPELQPCLARNLNWCKAQFASKKPKKMEPLTWRPWQQELLDIVTQPCDDDRTIHWVHDPHCGAGKTSLANFLIRNHGAIILNGKTNDVLHAYDDQEIVIFDIPKDAQTDDKDFIPYGAIEKIKDGIFFSGKYEGRAHCRDDNAHVVVFANCMPKPGCWDPKRTRLWSVCAPTSV